MLKGSKVILREKRWSDADKDYLWKTDAHLAALDAAIPLEMSYSDFVASYMNELNYTNPRSLRLSIDTLDGKHIGNCTYYNLDKYHGEVEVGIMIGDSSYWNQGYGTEAITLLVDSVFHEMTVGRIYLHTLKWNTRAQQCFHKCGFVPCGYRTRDGHEFTIMEMHRSTWENANSISANAPSHQQDSQPRSQQSSADNPL